MHQHSRIGRLVAGTAILLAVVGTAAGCATGRVVTRAEAAVKRGDLDAAVAYYRQALAAEPGRVDLRIQLERTTRLAAAAHLKRARDLEMQDQIAGAIAEYRLAADLDPASTVAGTKAAELERRLRALVESSRPQPRIESLRQQAAQASPIPRLDPRTEIPELRFTNIAIRDLLKVVADLTGINVTYDQAPGFEALLARPYSIDVRRISLEDLLTQVLQANTLTFKVVNAQTIFVYQDTQQNRQRYEDQYTQTFYISNVDPQTDILPILQQVVATGPTGVAPRIVVNKSANAIVVRASAPILQLVEQLIRTNDRPRPEVMVEAEILEVDRSLIRQLGLDLSQYALGFTFSPELAPPATGSSAGAYPGGPPPFNLNTISRGVSAADFYLTSPTALVRLLESNSTTRVLAKPQSRGRAGEPMQLSLGDSIPIPSTSFQAAFGGAGGAATTPVTQVTYQEVGINLQFTPRVTYQDEIVLDALLLEKSGLGNFITVAGQSFPTIVRRRATGSLRLRDGESNLIAGLLRDDDRKSLKSLPGIASIPLLRSLFGSSDQQVDQTDIIMIITPHIVRSHELTPADLRPTYVGTGQNVGSGTPPLISLEAIGAAPESAPAPTAGPPSQASAVSPTAGVTPGVAIEAVTSGAPGAPPAAPATGRTRIVLTAPDGPISAGSGPYTMPITIAGAPPLASLALTITFDASRLTVTAVTAGSFMAQGGVTPAFVPRIGAGRVDLAVSRPPGQSGALNDGVVAALSFTAGTPGASEVSITGVATSASGQSVPMEFSIARVIVR